MVLQVILRRKTTSSVKIFICRESLAHAIARAETTFTSFAHNLAKQKNWIFLLDQISPSASSIRDLGTRLPILNVFLSKNYWGFSSHWNMEETVIIQSIISDSTLEHFAAIVASLFLNLKKATFISPIFPMYTSPSSFWNILEKPVRRERQAKNSQSSTVNNRISIGSCSRSKRFDVLGSSLFVSTATSTSGGLLSVFRDFVSAQKRNLLIEFNNLSTQTVKKIVLNVGHVWNLEVIWFSKPIFWC